MLLYSRGDCVGILNSSFLKCNQIADRTYITIIEKGTKNSFQKNVLIDNGDNLKGYGVQRNVRITEGGRR